MFSFEEESAEEQETKFNFEDDIDEDDYLEEIDINIDKAEALENVGGAVNYLLEAVELDLDIISEKENLTSDERLSFKVAFLEAIGQIIEEQIDMIIDEEEED